MCRTKVASLFTLYDNVVNCHAVRFLNGCQKKKSSQKMHYCFLRVFTIRMQIEFSHAAIQDFLMP